MFDERIVLTIEKALLEAELDGAPNESAWRRKRALKVCQAIKAHQLQEVRKDLGNGIMVAIQRWLRVYWGEAKGPNEEELILKVDSHLLEQLSCNELDDLIRVARAAYEAMTPEQKQIHDQRQRESFARGLMPFDRTGD